MENVFTVSLPLPFEEAVENVRSTLAEHGFGIITEIDVKATLKKKMYLDFKNYLILGACNPKYAHQAIEADDNVGLLLPCNVIVYETSEGITVSSMKPTHMLNLLGNKAVFGVAAAAEKIFEDVFADLTP